MCRIPYFLKGYKQKGWIHQKRKGYIRKGKFLLEKLFRFIILCEAKYIKEFRIFKKKSFIYIINIRQQKTKITNLYKKLFYEKYSKTRSKTQKRIF